MPLLWAARDVLEKANENTLSSIINSHHAENTRYRGENPAPGKDVYGELDPTPVVREQARPIADVARDGVAYHSAGGPVKEDSVYAAIRQGKAKTGMAEELARRIKEGAIPIISDVEGFMAYYVVYAPDDTVTAISIFNNYAGAEESNRRVLAWIEESLAPLLVGPPTATAGPVIVHTLG